MKISPYLFIFLVSICNIGLNLYISKSAKKHTTFLDSLLSYEFLLAFIIGTLSIFSMLKLYKYSFNLGQGLIIMGATSIILGTIYSVWVLKNKIDFFDYILLGLIILVYLTKFIKTLQ